MLGGNPGHPGLGAAVVCGRGRQAQDSLLDREVNVRVIGGMRGTGSTVSGPWIAKGSDLSKNQRHLALQLMLIHTHTHTRVRVHNLLDRTDRPLALQR